LTAKAKDLGAKAVNKSHSGTRDNQLQPFGVPAQEKSLPPSNKDASAVAARLVAHPLRMKAVGCLSLIVVLVIVGACIDAIKNYRQGRTGSQPSTENETLASVSGLDPANLSTTARYLATRLKQVIDLAHSNELAAKQRQEEIRKELNTFVGTRVNWKVIVNSVTGDVGERVVWAKQSHPQVEVHCLSRMANTEIFGDMKIIVGEHITQGLALKLRTGDTVTIEGVIASISFDPFDWRNGVCVRLADAWVRE
jgi:hypothetical protein